MQPEAGAMRSVAEVETGASASAPPLLEALVIVVAAAGFRTTQLDWGPSLASDSPERVNLFATSLCALLVVGGMVAKASARYGDSVVGTPTPSVTELFSDPGGRLTPPSERRQS
jgi:hypothetical protein